MASGVLGGRFPGPNAEALSAVASALAEQGKVAEAFEVEAELEGKANDGLVVVRDQALEAIAEAQRRADDLQGAFATLQRVTQPSVRWRSLLELVATPLHP